MPNDEFPRQVIREHRFERELRKLIREGREADEFVEGAEFIAARNPEIGTAIGGGVWFLPMAPVAGDEIRLYYTYDDSRVWLLSIRREL